MLDLEIAYYKTMSSAVQYKRSLFKPKTEKNIPIMIPVRGQTCNA